MNKLVISKSGHYDLAHKKNFLEIYLEKNIKVTIKDSMYSSIRVILNSNSELIYILNVLNKKDNTKSLNFEFIGEGTNAKIKCFYEGKGNQKSRITTLQHHKASNSFSDLEIRGVFHDEASFYCENLIRIEKGIQKVSAREHNKNLLIGDMAKVVSIPKLEIEAHDVSCQHGSAISRLNNEHLFYLKSRGINLDEAKKTLIKAFLK